jgi:hypothetical protein
MAWRSDVDSTASRATQSWHAVQRRRSYAEEGGSELGGSELGGESG